MSSSPITGHWPLTTGHFFRLPAAVLAGALLLAWANPSAAVTNLKSGDEAPAAKVPLADLDGKPVTLESYRGRVVIVVFGEFYHPKTRQACEQIQAALKDPRLNDQRIVSVMIVTQSEAPAAVPAETDKAPAGSPWPAVVLLDKERKLFGAYQVAVLPSVVVLDKQGRVVHATAGLIDRFSDVVTDALLLATGKLSAERFGQTLHPSTTSAPDEDEKVLRAERISHLADQLARRGMEDAAAEKYAEALGLDPKGVPAMLGLGELMLKRRRLAEAETQFRAALARQPESAQGAIGLAFVQLLRGGSELVEAEKTVRQVLARTPSEPRAHYLMGLIFEQRHQTEEAAASFKKAAELLLALERSEGR